MNNIEWTTFDEYNEKTNEPISSFTGRWSFLSNFSSCDVEYEGYIYPTVEHAYQAAKTDNPTEQENIRQAHTPGEAKRLGKKVQIKANWEDIKLSVMEGLLRQKFVPLTDLSTMLVQSRFRELIEGNTWGDVYWGVCNGKGKNHLGKLLMRIRSEMIPPWGFVEKFPVIQKKETE